MNLWQEMFNPSPVTKIPITEDDFNSAWNWIWTNQNPALVLTLIRRKSSQFRRAGNGMDESAQMAAISLWQRFRMKRRKWLSRRQESLFLCDNNGSLRSCMAVSVES